MDPIITGRLIKAMEKRSTTLNQVVLIVMPVAATIGAYYWYRNNIWKPKVTVASVDFVSGTADVDINGKPKKLYTGSTITAGFGWGIRFAGDEEYNRIELVKNDLTHEVLALKN